MVRESLIANYEIIRVSHEYSKSQIVQIIERIQRSIPAESIERLCIVLNGSYARGEACRSSDLDYFIITDRLSSDERAEVCSKFDQIVIDVIGIRPSVGGPFARVICKDDLLSNIGGDNDSNINLTQRILFLIEGICLTGSDLFHDQRRKLVDRYISDKITDHQLGLFFLNDLIRYYRTICVDFEFKTVEQDKPWGIRNIKLIFSRKLIYFSGILMAAELAQRSPSQKKEIFFSLLDMTPVERIITICGASCDRAMIIYSEFLQKIHDDRIRSELEGVTKENSADCEIFRRLKNSGHHFFVSLDQRFTCNIC